MIDLCDHCHSIYIAFLAFQDVHKFKLKKEFIFIKIDIIVVIKPSLSKKILELHQFWKLAVHTISHVFISYLQLILYASGRLGLIFDWTWLVFSSFLESMEKLNDNDVDQICRAAAIFLYHFKTSNTTNAFSPVEVAEKLRRFVQDVPHDDYFKLLFK